MTPGLGDSAKGTISEPRPRQKPRSWLRLLWPLFASAIVVGLSTTPALTNASTSAGLPASIRASLRDVPFLRPVGRAGIQTYTFAVDLFRSNGGPFPGARVSRAADDAIGVVSRGFKDADTRIATPRTNSPIYPLRVSGNSRYLTDQTGQPFMVVGDSPQAMIGNLSLDEADLFLANRRAAGFNSVWVNLLCNMGTGCQEDGSTFDGIAPFTVPGDLSTPEERYFARVDAMLQLAQRHDINVFLCPIETIGWLGVLRENGVDKAYQYGTYLGTRYRTYPNIVWMSGNDFQTWSDQADNAVVFAVARGIHDSDDQHMQTVELNYLVSASLDDQDWSRFVDLNAVYSYYPTYAKILLEYGRPMVKPVFMIESTYEFEGEHYDFGTAQVLRRQEYRSILSGSTGHFYGNKYTWQFIPGWKSMLDTIGSIQMRHVINLFESRQWYALIPDQDHSVVIAGIGTFADTGGEGDTDYLTAARTADGSLIVAYMPTLRMITIDMSKLKQSAMAHWYDPTSGEYILVSSSLLDNFGTMEFVPPGTNRDGDGDWVLVLEVTRGFMEAT